MASFRGTYSLKLIDCLQNPEPHALAIKITISQHLVRSHCSLQRGSVAMLLDHRLCRSVDVDIGRHAR